MYHPNNYPIETSAVLQKSYDSTSFAQLQVLESWISSLPICRPIQISRLHNGRCTLHTEFSSYPGKSCPQTNLGKIPRYRSEPLDITLCVHRTLAACNSSAMLGSSCHNACKKNSLSEAEKKCVKPEIFNWSGKSLCRFPYQFQGAQALLRCVP